MSEKLGFDVLKGPGGLQSVPGGLLDPSWSLFSSLRPLVVLLETSWDALGGLWSQKKSALERLLAAPRGIPRQVSAILEAKRLPKGSPRGSEIEPKMRLELETRIRQKVVLFERISLIYEVLGSLFWKSKST